MFSRRLSLIPTQVAATCSGLSHWVGQALLRPILQALQPQAILRIEGLRPDQKLVVLTIDDAPSSETAGILDMLRDHDATATFFIHGAKIRGAADKQLVHRILDEGHEVGNHMPESVPSMQLKPFEFAAEFERNHRILLESGADPVRLRPSHGFYNRAMAEFMRTRGVELGYRPKFYLGRGMRSSIFPSGMRATTHGLRYPDGSWCFTTTKIGGINGERSSTRAGGRLPHCPNFSPNWRDRDSRRDRWNTWRASTIPGALSQETRSSAAARGKGATLEIEYTIFRMRDAANVLN